MKRLQLFILSFLIFVCCAQTSADTTCGDTIAFKIGNDKRIYVSVQINNAKRPYRFLVDTGATDIVLNAAIPEMLQLAPFTEEVTNQGATSTETIPCTPSNQTVKVGNTVLTGVRFLAIRYPPHFWDGVLGLSFLKSFDVIFNYERKEIYLYPQGEAPIPSTPSVDFTYREGVPIIPITATINENHYALNVEIDSGSDRVLDINTPYVNKHHLRGSKPVFAVSTIAGTAKTEGKLENVCFDAVKIGTTTFPLLPGAFSTLTTGLQSSAAFDGVLGNNLLMRFNQQWDFTRQKIYFSVNNNFYTPFYDFLISQ